MAWFRVQRAWLGLLLLIAWQASGDSLTTMLGTQDPTIASYRRDFKMADFPAAKALLTAKGAGAFAPPYVTGWRQRPHGGSGGQHVGFLASAALRELFLDVFSSIPAAANDLDLAFALSPTNLFHGHVYLGPEADLLILFHAMEFPNDLPGYGRYGTDYDTWHPSYRFRNIIYHSRQNQLAFLDLGPGSPFLDPFAYPPDLTEPLKSELQPAIEAAKTIYGAHLLADFGVVYVGDINWLGGELYLARPTAIPTATGSNAR